MATLGDLMKPMPAHVPGMVVPPTMDPAMNHNAINPNGDVSTIRTIGINVDGLETVIPTITPDGQFLTNAEAIEQFRRTGRHLGMFRTRQQADEYGQQLHQQEQQRIGPVMRPMPSHGTLADMGQ